MNINLLIMAAGNSKRFKQTSNNHHKLLHPCDDNNQTAMLTMTYQKACEVFHPDNICIITNHDEIAVTKLAQSLGCSVLTIHTQGIGDSIQQAVAAHKDKDALLILHGDLPFIRPDTIKNIANAIQLHEIVRPKYQQQFGHPVGFQKSFFPQLMALRNDQGANKILTEYPFTSININDAGAITDIDTLKDLEKFLLS